MNHVTIYKNTYHRQFLKKEKTLKIREPSINNSRQRNLQCGLAMNQKRGGQHVGESMRQVISTKVRKVKRNCRDALRQEGKSQGYFWRGEKKGIVYSRKP